MPPHVIKVCGITNLDDAIAAVEGGATAIGFNFYPNSKRYIKVKDAARIASALPRGVTKVGVFVNESPAEIERIAKQLGLDVAQLHGDEKPQDAPANLRIWKAYRVDESFEPQQLDSFPNAEAFLLDGPAGAEFGGSGKPFAWRIAADAKRPIVIAGGLDASNIREAITQARPWGVDACSRLESAPGKKDRTKMKEFLKAATSAEEPK
jgi:phosphoribosylanthranilate isomerase